MAHRSGRAEGLCWLNDPNERQFDSVGRLAGGGLDSYMKVIYYKYLHMFVVQLFLRLGRILFGCL